MRSDWSVTEIVSVIDDAELESICNPRDGDCEEVAVALHRVFEAGVSCDL